MKTLLKDFRVLLFLFCVVGSLFWVFVLPLVTTQQGVLVKSVAVDSPLYGKVFPGESITWVNEKSIRTPEDFYAFDNFVGTLRFMHDGRLELVEAKSGLGVIVVKQASSRINFGMDLVGGTRVLLKPKENVSDIVLQNVIATLQTRINIYGLREANFQAIKDVAGEQYVQIEMAGGSREEIENLLAKQGKFEAKIPKFVEIANNSGVLLVGGKNYTVALDGENIVVNRSKLGINQTFTLDEIGFEFSNLSLKNNGSSAVAVLNGLVFTSEDIKSVCIQDQPNVCRSFVQRANNGYEFVFQVFISQEGAERFANLTKDFPVVFEGGDYYLQNAYIQLFLDKKFISELKISSGLKGKAERQPSITGFRATSEEANKEKLFLQSVLQSGALPVGLDVVKDEQISATLGSGFISSAVFAGILAGLAVATVVFVRYRKIKIAVPVVLTSMSEVIIILGVASLINYTIDLAAIAGIIASVGTGVDAQIMIVDEMMLGGGKRIYTLKEKIKRAFFIIFSSAATVIAAMFPLMIIGIGVMRGFAIVTMIGVLVGVLIARPAFGRIAEALLEKEHG